MNRRLKVKKLNLMVVELLGSNGRIQTRAFPLNSFAILTHKALTQKRVELNVRCQWVGLKQISRFSLAGEW